MECIEFVCLFDGLRKRFGEDRQANLIISGSVGPLQADFRDSRGEEIEEHGQPRHVEVTEGGLTVRSNPVGVLVSQGFAHAADEFCVGADGTGHGQDGQLSYASEGVSKAFPKTVPEFPPAFHSPARADALFMEGLWLQAA
jgi:hypothetical protein